VILSVLDIFSPAHLPRLILHLDVLGYHRFWATEHHSPAQSASPTLIACLAAAMTSRLRVGTAGIMLNYACPAKVAEDFRLLELYFSGRVDLGITSASPAHEDLYIDGRPRPDQESFAARTRTLVDLVRGNHPVVVGPMTSTQPTLWMCGSSVSSAVLAGSLGMYFACHRRGAGSSERARDSIAAYRDAYRGPGASYAAVALHGACAYTDRTARQLWPADQASPCFVGKPSACVDQLAARISECGADEAVLQLLTEDIKARLAGYRLLAQAAGLAIVADSDAPSAHSRRLTRPAPSVPEPGSRARRAGPPPRSNRPSPARRRARPAAAE
jgi:alkanesulfonate monooxygenase SsuD/methylene tetrahydromethanopterin reductase-like flavin-dependent oxidoreductase (luciferase family)